MITRRQFLRNSFAAVAVAPPIGGVYAWRIEPHWLEITNRALPLRGLPAALEGRTLVQLSDLHVGDDVDDEYILDTFRAVTALDPDYVVFTGDFITFRRLGNLTQLRRLLRDAPYGRLGTAAALGNHDYGPAWSMADVADRIVDELANADIAVLRNDVVTLAGLQIAGLDDLWSGRFSTRSMMSRLDPRAPSIVLCHNPDGVDEPGWGEYQSWILAGHTHGGQFKPPFLPPPRLPVNNRRYTAGEFDLTGERRLYINRGVGHGARVRFNVRPEVTVFHLARTIDPVSAA